ncbi:MAG TPA: sulfite exporter TauE/SafE family protein [Bryobacteraceae bacterium]|nr:sulfite exporter TauE/SafE family protein [Bryobacteraceae bacterium]
MRFPVSGVECSFWLPPAAAFLVALLTAPAGISGAFLLLPFQISVLGFVTPAVTPTNLIYNLVATPGAIAQYIRERRMAWDVAWAVMAGTLPGVFLGAIIRIRFLPGPRYAKLFVGCVLLYLGVRLLVHTAPSPTANPDGVPAFHRRPLMAAALIAGIVGGIYGVGGGAMIAPFAMTVLRLPARAIAGAALLGTWATSAVGVASFEVFSRTALAASTAVRPDWALGLLFGVGGLAGGYLGARLQKRLPERWIRGVLGVLVTGLALTYVIGFLMI